MATRGVAFMSASNNSADVTAISASSAVSGSTTRPQSANTSAPFLACTARTAAAASWHLPIHIVQKVGCAVLFDALQQVHFP